MKGTEVACYKNKRLLRNIDATPKFGARSIAVDQRSYDSENVNAETR